LKYQRRYERLRVALRNSFSRSQGQSDPLAEFSGLPALLKEREERQAEDAKLDAEDEDHKQKMMVEEDEKVEDQIMATEDKKVEEALGYLLDKAIERFGYAARAVFNAIFDFDSATTESRDAFDMITSQNLKDTVISLATNHTVNFEHYNRIVAICPVYSASNPYKEVDWKVAFNSDWVATEVMKKLKDVEKIELHSLIQQAH
jgi:6-phosphofructokinase